MQNRILRATIDCLVKHGYAGITTTMVADRAAVSRGAFLHHFRTKEELVLAAVEHPLRSAQRRVHRRLLARPSQRRSSRRRARPPLAHHRQGDTVLRVRLELAVAGRSDEKLGKKVRELGSRTALAVERTLPGEPFPCAAATPNPFFDTARRASSSRRPAGPRAQSPARATRRRVQAEQRDPTAAQAGRARPFKEANPARRSSMTELPTDAAVPDEERSAPVASRTRRCWRVCRANRCSSATSAIATSTGTRPNSASTPAIRAGSCWPPIRSAAPPGIARCRPAGARASASIGSRRS